MFVRIKRRPIGEAPEWVRDAWIGLRLPVVKPRQAKWRTVGVVTGPRSILSQFVALACGRTDRIAGYNVDAKTAVDLLEVANPEAAEWWRTNARNLLNGRRRFVFDQEACDVEQR
jgi:hypothetical protein